MIELPEINKNLLSLLSDFNVIDLPNIPNVSGVFEQTDISFAIVSGEAQKDHLNTVVKISVAAERRTVSEEAGGGCGYITEEKANLYTLVSRLIFRLHNKKLPGCGLLKINSFECFTPDSGKWRAILTFSIPWYFDYEQAHKCEVLADATVTL